MAPEIRCAYASRQESFRSFDACRHPQECECATARCWQASNKPRWRKPRSAPEAVGVDVLVHVAGGFELSEPVSTLNRESWMRMTDLNAWSLVAVTQHLVPAMLVQGAGKVVAVPARGAASGAAEM
ncbi:SDR family NAD(P)-dependent oxidoreductase [Cupriavidus basilensis]